MQNQRELQREERRQARKSEIDLNNDGVISREEFMAAENRKLSRLDTDGDGAISKAEAEAAMNDRRGRKGGGRKGQE